MGEGGREGRGWHEQRMWEEKGHKERERERKGGEISMWEKLGDGVNAEKLKLKIKNKLNLFSIKLLGLPGHVASSKI